MIDFSDYPLSIISSISYGGHVQGIAVDKKNSFIYLSFTTELIKADLSGNIIGSIKGWIGHLGCIDYNDDDECVYGSLEIKNDSIGISIKELLKTDNTIPDCFYIAVFDTKRIDRKDINAKDSDILKTCFIKECTDDYINKRYGCSGIDGTCIADDIEDNHDRLNYLYVAYGIYKNNQEGLNDYQIILKYTIKDILSNCISFNENPFHSTGPSKPDNKYFIYTGNTNFGVQNLEYDGYTKDWLMAVYKGEKPNFPNYSYYIIDGKTKPEIKKIQQYSDELYYNLLSLKKLPYSDSLTPGFNFERGQEGIYSFDNGYFYIAKSKRSEDLGWYAQIDMYKISYDSKNIFEKVVYG